MIHFYTGALKISSVAKERTKLNLTPLSGTNSRSNLRLIRGGVQLAEKVKKRLGPAPLPNIFKCELCSKSFSNQGNFRRHLLTHESGERVRCEDPLCGKSFIDASGLDIHMEVSHYSHPERKKEAPKAPSVPLNDSVTPLEIRRWADADAAANPADVEATPPSTPVPACGIPSGDCLRIHQATCFGSEGFPNEPPEEYYNKRPESESTSKILGKSPAKKLKRETYRCEICGKSFGKLDLHMKTKHAKPEELVHHCGFCDKRFSYQRYLQMHIRQVHTSFKCPFPGCGRTFPKKSQLDIHTEMKHRTKPWTWKNTEISGVAGESLDAIVKEEEPDASMFILPDD